ncbi:MAG: hypothetical protein DMG88_18160 [Acidobacteria bacterium]|nr:MAG: hypothetical protein DMG88_18160 [Acidobacteriota bacterium]
MRPVERVVWRQRRLPHSSVNRWDSIGTAPPQAEDCGQANGASIEGRKVGTFGDMAIFSFQMNKNMTSGEGGVSCGRRATGVECGTQNFRSGAGSKNASEYEPGPVKRNATASNNCVSAYSAPPLPI